LRGTSPFGNLTFQLGSPGASKGQFHGIITATDVDQGSGAIYVLDGLGYERVQKFDIKEIFRECGAGA